MKLLIVRSNEMSTWGSCQVISPNLQKCYSALPDPFTIEWFDLPAQYLKTEIEGSGSYVLALSEKLQKERFDRLIFIDHLPNPAEILNNLSLVLELDRLPPVIIHLYGDFTYFSKEWLSVSAKLINHPVKFLTASEAQLKFFNHFCERQDSSERFFFPVDESEYFFDPKERAELRKTLGIRPEEIVLLYSGRVSLQKNVDLLVREYLKIIKDNDQSVHLWIVGAFDDMGAPFMGVQTKEGYLYSKIEQFLKKHPKEFIGKIKFFGMENKTRLRSLKAAADMFMSLSLYHDEDYGMSPAEALASGLPTLLTDWGGYSTFASSDWRCQLVPVAITEYGHKIKTSQIKNFFDDYLDYYITDRDRERWSRAFLNQFGTKAASARLAPLLSAKIGPFAGFNWQLSPFSEFYARTADVRPLNPSASPSDKNFYFQAYRHYISKEWVNGAKDPGETIQWMYDHVKSADNEIVTERRKNDRSYHRALFPFSQKYYSPQNPSLLFDGRINTKLTSQKRWTLRDGTVPLALFFKEQSPEVFQGEIAIDRDLFALVPPRWQESALFFDVEARTVYHRENLPRKILVAGMLNSTLADPEEMEISLLHLQRSLGEDALKNMEIVALFPNKKKELWGKWDESEMLKASSLLFKYLKNDIQFTTWSKIKHENSFRDCLYYEINEKHFISDSFLKHFALSRGAGLLISEKASSFGERVETQELSLYHRMHFYRPDFAKLPLYKDPFLDEQFYYFKNLYQNNTKNPETQTSWDSWFAYYLKKYYRQKRSAVS